MRLELTQATNNNNNQLNITTMDFIKRNLGLFIIRVLSLVATVVSFWSLLISLFATTNETLANVSLAALFLSALVALIANELIEDERFKGSNN